MIRKIISGGQTGADQAALDVAIKLGIPHGGWIPKGRMTEAGPLPDKYILQEMDTTSYPKRTERNVVDSNGTLIFSHGPLASGSLYTRKMAKKHDRPWLHVNLGKMGPFEATITTYKWIMKNEIEALNVAGPRASKDSTIYGQMEDILETAINYCLVKSEKADVPSLDSLDKPPVPKTVDEAVKRLVSELPLEDPTRIANMSIDEVELLHVNLGTYIRNNFGLWEGNRDLMFSCEFKAEEKNVHVDPAAAIIMDVLWRELRKTHKLRVVK